MSMAIGASGEKPMARCARPPAGDGPAAIIEVNMLSRSVPCQSFSSATGTRRNSALPAAPRSSSLRSSTATKLVSDDIRE